VLPADAAALLRDEPLVLGGVPFLRDDARAARLAPERLTGLVAAGILRQPIRGVYLDNRVPDDITSRAACLRLRLPPGAVVSRLTAAWLYGVDGRLPEQQVNPIIVECTVPPGLQPVRRPSVRSYVAPLSGDTCLVLGIPSTTAGRTAVDALRWLKPHMGLAVADALARQRLIEAEDVVERLQTLRGLPGIRQARYLAGLIEARTESFGESWLRLRIVDAGFPRPRVQIEMMDAAGRCVYPLDLGWEELRIAIEYDGDEFHSTPEQIARDRRRREDLEQNYGWRVLAVGKGEVLGSSMALERAIGELLSREPRIWRRRW
jgi:hypothetical protein